MIGKLVCYLLTGHRPYWVKCQGNGKIWLLCSNCGHETPGVEICHTKTTAA